jgi:hypothetical protein
MTIQSVKVNEEIPADRFEPPAEIKTLLQKAAAPTRKEVGLLRFVRRRSSPVEPNSATSATERRTPKCFRKQRDQPLALRTANVSRPTFRASQTRQITTSFLGHA